MIRYRPTRAGRGVLLVPVAFAYPGTVVTTEQPLQPTGALGGTLGVTASAARIAPKVDE